MGPLKHQLEELGHAVRKDVDKLEDPQALEDARRRFLQRARPSSRRRSSRPVLFALAGAALLGLGAFVALEAVGPPPISFDVGVDANRGVVGEWLAPAIDEPLPVRFSDGTRLELGSDARLRVTSTTHKGASVVLERGSVAATVSPKPGSAWLVSAGPFEVHVKGTAFDLVWEPENERLVLVMREGAVLAKGPLLQEGREVLAGERLEVLVRERRLEVGTARSRASGAPSDEAGATAAPPEDALEQNVDASAAGGGAASGDESGADSKGAARARRARPHASGAASALPPESEPPEPAADWRALSRDGKHKESIAVVEQIGIGAVLAGASASELAQLADTARFAGRPKLAREALVRARERGARGHTAFLLGKIAADQGGSAGEAIRWFETYLAEQPTGPLAEQALGRILEFKRHGDPEVAKATAERYLARFPNGAHAPVARGIVER